MTSQTNEQALEACMEKALTGSFRELRTDDITEATPPIYGPHAGYEAGFSADFDREFAIDRPKFWRFLQETQPKELNRTTRHWNMAHPVTSVHVILNGVKNLTVETLHCAQGDKGSVRISWGLI